MRHTMMVLVLVLLFCQLWKEMKNHNIQQTILWNISVYLVLKIYLISTEIVFQICLIITNDIVNNF